MLPYYNTLVYFHLKKAKKQQQKESNRRKKGDDALRNLFNTTIGSNLKVFSPVVAISVKQN